MRNRLNTARAIGAPPVSLPENPLAVILVVAFSLTLPGHSAPDSPPWHSYRKCEDNGLVKTNPLPAALNRERLVKDLVKRPLAKSDSVMEFACNGYGKQWKSQKTPTTVAFLETITYRHSAEAPGGAEIAHPLWIGVYRQEAGGGYTLIATASKPPEIEQDKKVMQLDFAPYRITPDQVAFGVRISQNFMYGGGGGTNEFLNLYRVQATDIVPILGSLMASSSMTAGGWDEEGNRDHQENGDEKSAILSILTTKTGGYFDLKKARGKKSAIFKWAGDSYKMAGKDPVEDVNGP